MSKIDSLARVRAPRLLRLILVVSCSNTLLLVTILDIV